MRDYLRPTALEAVERRFNELTAAPAPLALDGCTIGHGLPPRSIPLDELRIILLKRQTSWHAKDAAWTELVRRAQEQGEPWITAAMGMMMPALKKIAGNAARGFRGEIADFDSEIVEGFLCALNTVDAAAPKVYSSLYFMARRYGQEARIGADRLNGRSAEYDEIGSAGYRPVVAGHPDLVLARAVRDRGISSEEADLIAMAHLDGEGMSKLAEAQGTSPYLVRRRLAGAEERLARFLSDSFPREAA
ncbi:hypothetical protein AB0I53_14355 [Saccharopolyspora sp. NPDC050389]|uniref:hypothetical protein n=1 Tax=Saccharopolyspora sp. NPDC050389 TaxID=3155516 RepID=UPI0033E374CB